MFINILKLRRLVRCNHTCDMFSDYINICKFVSGEQKKLKNYEITEETYARREGFACGWGNCLGIPDFETLNFIDNYRRNKKK